MYRKFKKQMYAFITTLLRIDNGDFRVNSLVFTFSLIYPYLDNIFLHLIHGSLRYSIENNNTKFEKFMYDIN